MKEHTRHFHLHEVYGPSLTFYVIVDDDNFMRVSWAICAADDNFSRKIGLKLAQNNMSHKVYVEGFRNPAYTIQQDIINILRDGHFAPGIYKSPRKNPEGFRDQAIRAMEEFHVSEAILQDIERAEKGKKSLYWDRILPILFKSKTLRKHFWGTD